MRLKVIGVRQHLGGGGRWDTEVRLADGSEFHAMVPGFEWGDEVDVAEQGAVTVTQDGKPYTFTPKWVRAAIPAPLDGVELENEVRLRAHAEKRYGDRVCQDAWIQGAAWNVQGSRDRAFVERSFPGGPALDAALRGWDDVEIERSVKNRPR